MFTHNFKNLNLLQKTISMAIFSQILDLAGKVTINRTKSFIVYATEGQQFPLFRGHLKHFKKVYLSISRVSKKNWEMFVPLQGRQGHAKTGKGGLNLSANLRSM